jgi:hypothetical protein
MFCPLFTHFVTATASTADASMKAVRVQATAGDTNPNALAARCAS